MFFHKAWRISLGSSSILKPAVTSLDRVWQLDPPVSHSKPVEMNGKIIVVIVKSCESTCLKIIIANMQGQ